MKTPGLDVLVRPLGVRDDGALCIERHGAAVSRSSCTAATSLKRFQYLNLSTTTEPTLPEYGERRRVEAASAVSAVAEEGAAPTADPQPAVRGVAYGTHCAHALSMIGELEQLNRDGRLGELSVDVATTLGGSVELIVRCQRLTCLEGIIDGYMSLLQSLGQPAVRSAFVQKNGEEMLEKARDCAVAGIVYAGNEAQRFINEMMLCNCNQALCEWVAKQMSSGALSPTDPRVEAYVKVQQTPHYEEMIRAGSRVGIRGIDAVHRAWLRWAHRETQSIRVRLEEIASLMRSFRADESAAKAARLGYSS